MKIIVILSFVLLLAIVIILYAMVNMFRTIEKKIDMLYNELSDMVSDHETYLQIISTTVNEIHSLIKDGIPVYKDRHKTIIDKIEHLIKIEKVLVESLEFIQTLSKNLKKEILNSNTRFEIKANTIDADIKEIKQSMFVLEQRAKDCTKFEEDVICKHIFNKLNSIIETLDKIKSTSKTTTKSKAKNSSSKSNENNNTKKSENCNEKLKTAEKCEVTAVDCQHKA